MFHAVFAWACLILSAVVFASLAILSYLLDRRGRLAHRTARLWAKTVLLTSRVKVAIDGREHVQGQGPYVFMSNHQGSYDIFALLGALPVDFKWLAKKELFSIPLLGWAMSAAGYISVDREGTRDTVKAMNEAAQKIQDGASVVIFPEGTRSPDGLIQPFKKGGFSLAIKSQSPIVPVAISGSREILPKDQWRIHPGRIRICLYMPLETRGASLGDWKEIMDRVHEAISTAYQRISQV